MNYNITFWRQYSLDNLKDVYNDINYIEEWRDIKGYEGLYQVSSFGRIKSLSRTTYIKGVKNRFKNDIILHQTKDELDYVRVSLSKQGKIVVRQVHILVGNAFIPNPERKKTINHIKGNPLDNRYWMLEWATQKENIQHSFSVLNRVSNLKGKTGINWPHYGKIHPAFGKKHKRLDLAGDKHFKARRISCDTLGIIFNCIKDASEAIGLSTVSIHKVLKNDLLHSQGLVFRYIIWHYQ